MESKINENNIIRYRPNPLKLEVLGDFYEMKRRLTAIVLGNLLFSFGVNAFYTPHMFLSGGIGGISIMIQYLTGISAGILVFILNLPLFLVGLRSLSKKFLFYAFISTIVQSLTMIVFRGIDEYISFDNSMLSAIVGGVLNGTAMGILFKNGCCQGGFDIVAAVMKKKYNMQIGSVLMMLNMFVVGIGSYLFGIDRGAYTLIAMYLSYSVLDKVQMSKGDLKAVYIASYKSPEIAKAITLEMSRGVTMLHSEGGWSRQEGYVLYLVVNSREVAILKRIVSRIDDGAFVGISELTEVHGRGFKKDEVD
ncbi:MAG: YitT family protein [Ezakiella sp.]|nr:YitT family protein [Ezakiella sp.]MDD7761065.1 YitT family protein [Bacillota bacterium]MDY3946435.1 YitT family protein [Ezakiella sp.]